MKQNSEVSLLVEISGRNRTSSKQDSKTEGKLEDKTPAGDAGVENNTNEIQAKDPIGESNY